MAKLSLSISIERDCIIGSFFAWNLEELGRGLGELHIHNQLSQYAYLFWLLLFLQMVEYVVGNVFSFWGLQFCI